MALKKRHSEDGMAQGNANDQPQTDFDVQPESFDSSNQISEDSDFYSGSDSGNREAASGVIQARLILLHLQRSR